MRQTYFHRLQQHQRRAMSLAGALAVLLGVFFASFGPWLGSRAAAVTDAPTNVNLTDRNKNVTLQNFLKQAYGGCSGKFTTVPKDANLMQTEWVPYLNQLTGFTDINQLKSYNSRLMDTLIGHYNFNNQGDLDQAWALLQGIGTTQMPIIQFQPGNAGNQTVNGTFGPSNGLCSNVRMIRVSGTEWRGWQIQKAGPSPAPGIAGPVEWMRFVMDGGQSGPNRGGTLCFHDFTPGSADPAGSDLNNPGLGTDCQHFVMEGSPDGGSADPGGGTINLGFDVLDNFICCHRLWSSS